MISGGRARSEKKYAKTIRPAPCKGSEQRRIIKDRESEKGRGTIFSEHILCVQAEFPNARTKVNLQRAGRHATYIRFRRN